MPSDQNPIQPATTPSDVVEKIVTLAWLKKIAPALPEDKVTKALPNFHKALRLWKIDTAQRICHFFAQLALESNQFRATVEVWGPTSYQLKYEGSQRLGNTHPGDGFKFRGHGWIQLTGRENHTRAGQALGYDFANHPELAAEPEIACQVACWYFATWKCNEAADQNDIVKVTHLINGGELGLAERKEFFRRAISAVPPDVAVCDLPT